MIVIVVSMIVIVLCVGGLVVIFFFFKQKTAYEMRISDWSSDVCSSDLIAVRAMARKMRRCGHADIASVTKGFAGRRVRQMDLDHRNRDRLDRVVQRHRRMGIAAAVEERRLRPREMRLVQPATESTRSSICENSE